MTTTSISLPGAVDAPRPVDPARDRLATHTLGAALLVGLAGDLLLRGGGLGLGALLFARLTTGVIAALDRSRDEAAARERQLLLLPILFAGVVAAWRASVPLTLAAVVGAVAAAALLADAMRTGPGWSLWRLDPFTPIAAMLRTVGAVATGAPILLWRDVPPGAAGRGTVARAVGTWGRGALVAVPLLIVFNALLVAADPVYAKLLHRVFAVDVEELLGHVVATAILTWAMGGWLRTALLGRAPRETTPRRIGGGGDVLLPIAVVNALFVVFVLVQLRTFVGGAAYVKATAGITFAEYARRGFFELLWVTALALPALVVADALAPLDHVVRRRLRVLAAMTLALLVAILASAATRMALYLDAYGLTEQRFYASVAMAWLFLVTAWFGATVLRGRRERFAGGALAAAFALLVAITAVNPDALIVRANLARLPFSQRELDVRYVTQLSADATPALVDALRIPDGKQWIDAEALCEIRAHVARDVARRAGPDRDWRSWTVAGMRADRAAITVADPKDVKRRCPKVKEIMAGW